MEASSSPPVSGIAGFDRKGRILRDAWCISPNGHRFQKFEKICEYSELFPNYDLLELGACLPYELNVTKQVTPPLSYVSQYPASYSNFFLRYQIKGTVVFFFIGGFFRNLPDFGRLVLHD